MAKQPLTLEIPRNGQKTASGIPQRASKKVALTLRLDQGEYERLVMYSARSRQKHQTVIHEALINHLNSLMA